VAIGYKGDLLETRIEQKPGVWMNDDGDEVPGPLNEEVMARKIAEAQKELSEMLKLTGRPKQVWIGGGAPEQSFEAAIMGFGAFVSGPGGLPPAFPGVAGLPGWAI